ncbi:TolB family protein [Amycolatopsis sp. NPDC051903]|uniref:TolB family protein n=1 Tax=Amycolatopsis sp. NPDC051903 TaxID=3363936 RepID=UPI00378C032E
MKTRVLVAVAGIVVLIAAAAVYVGMAAAHNRDDAATGTVSLTPGPRLLVRSTADGSRGHLVTVSAADPGGARTVSPVTCARVYAAGGTGLCLRQDGDLTTYQLAVLNSGLVSQREIPLVGLPNRARVSPSGRMVAWTVFVTGDSYNGGTFSTRAGILDTRTGELAPSLEDYAVTLAGKPYHAVDLNFWGVSFTRDDHTFYATMSTAGHRYLVRGDFRAHTIVSLRENVECPSLSPDETRIAFKSAIDDDPNQGWRLSVLDLASGRVTPLAESRNVDDQAAWLDNRSVAYGIPRGTQHSDVWTVAADGSGVPRVLVPDAESPAALS